MVEPLLYAALGFLTASLLALFMGRALWNRAVRLTTRRVMRRLPLSRDEIVASRDLLRAEQAIEHRRLERQTNIMRQRMTQSLADLGRRDASVVALRTTAEELKAQLAAAEARETAGLGTIAQLQGELKLSRERLTGMERKLADAQRQQGELLTLADNRRVETAAAGTELVTARQSAAALETQLTAIRAELADARSRLNKATQTARSEGERAEAAHQKLLAAEAQLAQALSKAEAAGRDAGANPDEVALLRGQIERLAADLARAAGPAKGRSAEGGTASRSARSRQTETAGANPASPTAG